MKVGRQKRYADAAALAAAVEAYFESISRTVEAKERFDTGEKDSDGRKIFEECAVKNDKGEPIRYVEYVVPPTVGGLCEFLGLHRKTWEEYCDAQKHPALYDVTTGAMGRMRAWNERELLMRKDVRGIIFNLQNNYGYLDKREIELGPKAAGACTAQTMSLSEKAALLEELRREAPGTGDEGHGAFGH